MIAVKLSVTGLWIGASDEDDARVRFGSKADTSGLMAGMGGKLTFSLGRSELLARADQLTDFGGSVLDFPIQEHLA